MKVFVTHTIYILLVLNLISLSFAQNISWKSSAKNGLVVAGKKSAVASGIEMLEKGGNAADAAVAALLTLSVKHIGAFCIGGEVPLIVYNAENKEVKVLSGQGAAPLDQKAVDWYYRNGIPGSNIKAAAVPAVIDLCIKVLKLYGTMSFEEVVTPTLKILDAGGSSWYIDTSDGDTVDTQRNWYADLAKTLRRLIEAEQTTSGNRREKLQAATNRFYRGDIADELEEWYIEKGGFLRKMDLIAHETRLEDAISTRYKDYTIFKCGPWTQGPYLLQTLELLEGFDLTRMGHLSADYIHVITEAMKLALADRDEYYGDPRFVNVPLQSLLSDKYSNMRRLLINMKGAANQLVPGDPYQMQARKKNGPYQSGQGGTTTLCVADRWGNVVVATPSGLGSTAGSGGNTGVIHGSRLISLNTWKGHPNCIEPGKRPRITLTPTLILKDDKPVIAISVAGGDLQDQVAIQLILDYIEFGMYPAQAISVARFATRHHVGSFGQDKPDLASLRVNEAVGGDVIEQLINRGHEVKTTTRGIGGVAMLFIDTESGVIYGAGAACAGMD